MLYRYIGVVVSQIPLFNFQFREPEDFNSLNPETGVKWLQTGTQEHYWVLHQSFLTASGPHQMIGAWTAPKYFWNDSLNEFISCPFPFHFCDLSWQGPGNLNIKTQKEASWKLESLILLWKLEKNGSGIWTIPLRASKIIDVRGHAALFSSCGVGSCPVPCRTFISILGLYPLGVSSIPPPQTPSCDP